MILNRDIQLISRFKNIILIKSVQNYNIKYILHFYIIIFKNILFHQNFYYRVNLSFLFNLFAQFISFLQTFFTPIMKLSTHGTFLRTTLTPTSKYSFKIQLGPVG